MAFEKGVSGNPDGRPKGARNKKDIRAEQLTLRAIGEGIMPLEFFLNVLRDPNMPLGFRFEAGKAAAPYVHRKMPIAIENLDAPFKVLDMESLTGLEDDELETLHKLMKKAAAMEARSRDPALDPRVITAPQAKQLPAPKPQPKKRNVP